MAWLTVIVLGLCKWPAKLLAPVAVFFVDRNFHSIWGVQDATDLSWYNIAIRNGAHNMTVRPQVGYNTKTNTDDETLEKLEGFQWRQRKSLDGKYVSFRMTWGKPRKDDGKREFYVGWTMNQNPYMRLTFFQFRPF